MLNEYKESRRQSTLRINMYKNIARSRLLFRIAKGLLMREVYTHDLQHFLIIPNKSIEYDYRIKDF